MPTFNVTISETANAQASIVARLIANLSITQAASATDTPTAAVHYDGVTEAVTAGDSSSITTDFNPRVLDSAAATEVIMVHGGYGADLSEVASAADTPSGGFLAEGSITEVADAADTLDGGSLKTASLQETAAASTSLTVIRTLNGIVHEAASAATTIPVVVSLGVSLTEAANAIDLPGISYATSLSEAASASDVVRGGFHVGITEPGSAADGITATRIFHARLNERAAAVDVITEMESRQTIAQGNPIFATDVFVQWQPFDRFGEFDFEIEGGDLASHRDLVTSITLSLFCNRRALRTDPLPNPRSRDRQGWWGDAYLVKDLRTGGQPLGSRLWLLSRSKSSALLPITAKFYVNEALSWVTARKIASSLDVQTFFIASDPSKLGIIITLYQRGSKKPLTLSYKWAWNQVAVYPSYIGKDG